MRINSEWVPVPLAKVLKPVSRPEPVLSTKIYRILGAHWYAQGLYVKDIKSGSEIQAYKVYRVERGDFVYNRLFAWKGSFAVSSDENHGDYVSNEFPCFTVNQEIANEQYLWRYFSRSSTWEEALGLSSGGTPTSRNRLKEEKLLAMQIPLPPLDEQRRIVARIEELAAKIEEARGLRRETEEEVATLGKSAAKSIFANYGNEDYLPLRELVTICGGGTPSKSNPLYWEGTIPWVSPKDMKVREINDAVDHISIEATKESAAKLIAPGAVIMVVRGMILAHTVPTAILRTTATINQDMRAFIPNEKLFPEYLCHTFWALNQELLGLVEKSTHDTRRLDTPKLLDFKIPIPSLSEQRRIVAYLDDLQARVDAVRQLQAETRAELDGLLPSILDKAFRGELV